MSSIKIAHTDIEKMLIDISVLHSYIDQTQLWPLAVILKQNFMAVPNT